MQLPYDYARCVAPTDCPLAHKCARQIDKGRQGGPQVFQAFSGGPECDGYIQWPYEPGRKE
jgi:hypothetical protein